jgi:hypothetical protein
VEFGLLGALCGGRHGALQSYAAKENSEQRNEWAKHGHRDCEVSEGLVLTPPAATLELDCSRSGRGNERDHKACIQNDRGLPRPSPNEDACSHEGGQPAQNRGEQPEHQEKAVGVLSGGYG